MYSASVLTGVATEKRWAYPCSNSKKKSLYTYSYMNLCTCFDIHCFIYYYIISMC